MKHSKSKGLPADCEIMSVGIGLHEGKEVVILSLNKFPDGTTTVNIIDLDMSTKRQVQEDEVSSFYIKKGHAPK